MCFLLFFYKFDKSNNRVMFFTVPNSNVGFDLLELNTRRVLFKIISFYDSIFSIKYLQFNIWKENRERFVLK